MGNGSELGKPLKRAVALVIYDDQGRFLSVRRADDDDSLPGVWGLPAASLRDGETVVEAAVRAGRDKLGVEVEAREQIAIGRQERPAFVLELADWQVEVVKGTPSVPQNDSTVSQYADLRYSSDLSLLKDAAQQGSLCSQLFLSAQGIEWRDERQAGSDAGANTLEHSPDVSMY